MKKGISPVVSSVLLIALAVIISVGIYFWATNVDLNPTPSTATLTPISVARTGTSSFLVTNQGTTSLTLDLLNTVSGNTCTFTGTIILEPGSTQNCTLSGVPDCEEIFYGEHTDSAIVVLGSECN